jgi:hypothetical protein
LTELALDPPDASGALDEDYLILSTIHSAKGQEWDAVFVLNLVDGCTPSDMASGGPEQIDEERRLLYVAMTPGARASSSAAAAAFLPYAPAPPWPRSPDRAALALSAGRRSSGLSPAAPPPQTAPPMRCHCDRQRQSTSAPACAICGADRPRFDRYLSVQRYGNISLSIIRAVLPMID